MFKLAMLAFFVGIILLVIIVSNQKTKKKKREILTAKKVRKIVSIKEDEEHNDLMDKVMGVIENSVFDSDNSALFNPECEHGIMLTDRVVEELKILGYEVLADDNQKEKGSYVVYWS